jgi:uncharacterized protein YlbG (UPF0298 family)
MVMIYIQKGNRTDGVVVAVELYCNGSDVNELSETLMDLPHKYCAAVVLCKTNILLDLTHFDSEKDAKKREEAVTPEPFARCPRTFWFQ